MSISDKLTQLSEAKSAIASAIIAKGGTATGGFSSFADDISKLPTSGGKNNPFEPSSCPDFNMPVPKIEIIISEV